MRRWGRTGRIGKRLTPSNGGEGDGVGENKEITERDDRVCRRSSDLHFNAQVAVQAVGEVFAVASEDAADDEETGAHRQSAVYEQRSTAGSVDEEERGGGAD